MTQTILAFTLSLVLALAVGCAGVGVVATSDPLTKLNDAEYLFQNSDRPLIAERLILEALAMYQQSGDPHGLASSHREYADLLRSESVVGKWQTYYKENGFLDRSVTFDNRIAKSSEYYAKAIQYYEQAAAQYLASETFDKLTNVYYNMAHSYLMLENEQKACEYYEHTLNALNSNLEKNPGAKPYSSNGSVAVVVASGKKHAGCA